MRRHAKLIHFLLAASLIMSLQACTIPITLKTRPQGATVIANGEIIGSTPLEIDPDELFPARFKGYQWEREGTLRFERAGCKPQDWPINNESVKRSVRIDLDCEPGAAALAPKPSSTRTETLPTAKGGTIGRLEELNEMKRRGLISEDEYQRMRQRVIDSF